MPELPEVETVRTRLAPHVEGRTIARARIDDVRLVRPELPDTIAAALTGLAVERVERRGKYLLLRLDDGETLAIHLRMTGNLLRRAAGEEAPRAASRRAASSTTARSSDTPTCAASGRGSCCGTTRRSPRSSRSGSAPSRSPTRFSPEFLHASLRRRQAPIKAVLLDQRVVAGLGNIYADEALWAAKIHPELPASRLRRADVERLHGAIRDVLAAGIAAQGASIRDYRMPDGGHGSAQERFAVYGRTGLPCPRCGTPIKRLVVGQRGTHFCPHCQKLPRSARKTRRPIV